MRSVKVSFFHKSVFFAENDNTYLSREPRQIKAICEKKNIRKLLMRSINVFLLRLEVRSFVLSQEIVRVKILVFFYENSFSKKTTFYLLVEKTGLASSCFFRQHALIIFMTTLEDNLQNLTSGQGQVVRRVGSKLS